MEDIRTFMNAAPVIPVLVIDRADDAVPLARALVAGGLHVLEVTLRTPAALESIAIIARQVPEAIVGAGTVVYEEQVNRVAEAGARFIVSPGLTQLVARASMSARLPLLPGVANASDIMRGLELGLDAFKFFPAETSGGTAAIKALSGPFPSLLFCPTGGVTPINARDYLALSSVPCVGGSWLAPRDAVSTRDWKTIGRLASDAAALLAK